MRQAIVILRLDLSDNPHSDSFWEGSFTALAKSLSCPTTVEISVITTTAIAANEAVIPLVSRKAP